MCANKMLGETVDNEPKPSIVNKQLICLYSIFGYTYQGRLRPIGDAQNVLHI